MSRVVVNEIEAKVGNDISFNDTVKIDTIKGKTTAGSVTVQGEGTATTNLQQGLAKMFIDANQSSTQAINDSFNVSSISDTGTGLTEATLTNPHSTVHYGPVQGIHTANNRRVVVGAGAGAHTASIVKYEGFQESTYNTTADISGLTGNTHGDLA